MRPLMRLVLGLVALAAILAGVAFALPSQVTVARAVVINAPESAVFPYLNTPHRFNDWSPWAARDPGLQVTFAGPEQGQGASVEWRSGKQSVGTGSMQITESKPNRRIDLAVNLNGLEGTSYYEVAPSGSGSKVTWGFDYDSGPNPLRRWRALMLDRLLGADYRTGLDRLKAYIEAERRPSAPNAGAAPAGQLGTAPAVAPAAPEPVPAQ